MFSLLRLALAIAGVSATLAASIPAVPQPATENGSCGTIVDECFINSNPVNLFTTSYCALSAFCYYESTVDALVTELTRRDYLYTNPVVLSAHQPRLNQTVFNHLSKGKAYVSQQDIIDAYYGALTNTIKSCGGPPGAETPCPSGTSGPYPTNASYVIGFWNRVSAWTGFCKTRQIPYQNLADYIQYSSTIKSATTC